jgi:hypothetical protein
LVADLIAGIGLVSTATPAVAMGIPPSGGDNAGVQTIYTHVDGHAVLDNVSCPTTTWCMAGAEGGTVVTYNSGTWSAPTTVFPVSGSDVDGLSCPTTTFCMAVSYIGGYSYFSGGKWSKPVLTPDGWGVSCSTTTFCMEETGGFTDLEVWKGTNWSVSYDVADDPNGAGGQTAGPLSCLAGSTTDCVYVDNNDYYTTFDGSWVAMKEIPTSGGGAAVASCSEEPIAGVFEDGSLFPVGAKPTCTVVDTNGDAFTLHGSTWSAAGTVDHKAGIPDLAGVSCVYARCAAVDLNGNVLYEDNFAGPVGGWSKPFALKAAGSPVDISCASLSFCMVVTSAGDAVVLDPDA